MRGFLSYREEQEIKFNGGSLWLLTPVFTVTVREAEAMPPSLSVAVRVTT